MLTSSVLLVVPLVLFLALLCLGNEELGLKWILILLTAAGLLLAGFVTFGLPLYFFIAILAIADAILIIVIFGSNI